MFLLSALLKKNQLSPAEEAEMEEHSALYVLHHWGEMNEFLTGARPLVPEHVEIRSLMNQDNPGLPQVTDNYSTNSNDSQYGWCYYMSCHIPGLPSYVGGHVCNWCPSSARCWHQATQTWTVGQQTIECSRVQYNNRVTLCCCFMMTGTSCVWSFGTLMMSFWTISTRSPVNRPRTSTLRGQVHKHTHTQTLNNYCKIEDRTLFIILILRKIDVQPLQINLGKQLK